jgi:hypothetical protein
MLSGDPKVLLPTFLCHRASGGAETSPVTRPLSPGPSGWVVSGDRLCVYTEGKSGVQGELYDLLSSMQGSLGCPWVAGTRGVGSHRGCLGRGGAPTAVSPETAGLGVPESGPGLS